MKLILTADVNDLGKRGDVVEVAEGYARNFLLPRKRRGMKGLSGNGRVTTRAGRSVQESPSLSSE